MEATPGAVRSEPDVEALIDRLPSLAGAPRSVAPLPGGLTNANYKVATAAGTFVVRVAATNAALLAIDRVNEYENSVAAAEVGVGAPVVGYLDDPWVLVFEFIEGRKLSAAQLRRGDCLPAVAAACRRLHGARRFRSDFNMFDIQRGYLQIVRSQGFRLPDRYLEFEPQVQRMRAAMSRRPERTVPCNNDLLAENFIDDGQQIRIIDYEYSGNNEPSFELGNIWSESNLSLEQLTELVGSYYGRVLRHKVARARLWGVMSKYGWMLWASIQDAVAPIDFDFWQWGMEKYERAVAELTGADFERLMADVQRDD